MGQIGKFYDYEEGNKNFVYFYKKSTCDLSSVHIDEIIKCSNNIIDLIEEGDVLKYTICKRNLTLNKVGKVKKYKDVNSKEYLGIEGFSLEQIEILSIVTKEQFKNMEYKVGE